MSTLPPLSRPWLELLETVCQIDSRTTLGCKGTTQVAQILGHELERLGFSLSWHDTLPEEGPRGQHLIATRNADAPNPLVLIGHTDVILSPQEVPFRIDHDKQRVYGSGVCDMKGPDILMIHALADALNRYESVRQAGLVVMLNCAEETSSASFQELTLPWQRRASACLGFEPARYDPSGQDSIVSARKGIMHFHLECQGRAAHAGANHPMGINAVVQVARIAQAIDSLTDYSRGLTASVGIIQGGKVANQIPDEASLIWELRAFDPAVLEEASQRAREIALTPTVRSPSDDEPAVLTLSQRSTYPAWLPAPRHEALAERYIRIAATHGLNVTHMASGGAADASLFSPHVPTIDGLGILGGGAHSLTEWADLASYEARAHTAADLIGELVRG